MAKPNTSKYKKSKAKNSNKKKTQDYDNRLVNVGALWKTDTRHRLSGRFSIRDEDGEVKDDFKEFFNGLKQAVKDGEDFNFVVWQNTYKEEGSKQPDYNMLIFVPVDGEDVEDEDDDVTDDIPF